jgi:ATP synthase protein I
VTESSKAARTGPAGAAGAAEAAGAAGTPEPPVYPVVAPPAPAILRAALPATLGAGALLTAGSAIVDGGRGALGAAAGTALVVVFFGVDLIGWRRAARKSPDGPMRMAVFGYLIKIVGLGVLLMLLRGHTSIATAPFAVAALTGTVCWLGGHLRAFAKSGQDAGGPP